MSSTGWRDLTKDGLRDLAIEVLRTYLWPPLLAAGVALVGWLQGVPLFYVCVGTAVTFSAVASGILRFSEWRVRTRVSDKLLLDNVRVGKKLNDDGSAPSLALGFQLHNGAVFPVEFHVKSMHTELDGKYPPRKKYEVDRFTIHPNGIGWFDDYTIDIGALPRDRSIEGLIDFVVEYGRPGRLNCCLKKKIKVSIKFDENGDVQAFSRTDIR